MWLHLVLTRHILWLINTELDQIDRVHVFPKSINDITAGAHFLNYHAFVSQVTHWYSRRIRERVEEVTEKFSLVHVHTHTNTHTQLDSCTTEVMCTLWSHLHLLEAVSRRPSCFHALAGSEHNTKWQRRLSYMRRDSNRTGSDGNLSHTQHADVGGTSLSCALLCVCDCFVFF